MARAAVRQPRPVVAALPGASTPRRVFRVGFRTADYLNLGITDVDALAWRFREIPAATAAALTAQPPELLQWTLETIPLETVRVAVAGSRMERPAGLAYLRMMWRHSPEDTAAWVHDSPLGLRECWQLMLLDVKPGNARMWLDGQPATSTVSLAAVLRQAVLLTSLPVYDANGWVDYAVKHDLEAPVDPSQFLGGWSAQFIAAGVGAEEADMLTVRNEMTVEGLSHLAALRGLVSGAP